MHKEPTYEEALAHFRVQDIYWKAIVKGIRDMREDSFLRLVRNMETPTCDDRTDAKAIGYTLALGDLANELGSSVDVEVIPSETESH